MISVQVSKSGFRKLQAMMIKIQALSKNEKGFCYASNNYLAEQLGGISVREVRRRIELLRELRWLGYQVDYTQVSNRALYLLPGGQNVLGAKYSDLPENVQGGRTIGPGEVAKMAEAVANSSSNKDINQDKDNKEAGDDTGDDDLVGDTTGYVEGPEREGSKALFEADTGDTRPDPLFIYADRDPGDTIGSENGSSKDSGPISGESETDRSIELLPQGAREVSEVVTDDRDEEEARIEANLNWFRASILKVA